MSIDDGHQKCIVVIFNWLFQTTNFVLLIISVMSLLETINLLKTDRDSEYLRNVNPIYVTIYFLSVIRTDNYASVSLDLWCICGMIVVII